MPSPGGPEVIAKTTVGTHTISTARMYDGAFETVLFDDSQPHDAGVNLNRCFVMENAHDAHVQAVVQVLDGTLGA